MKKLVILGVFALFLAPALLAVLLNSQWLEWRPAETKNHGELIEPARRLPEFELTDADGATLSRDDLLDRWHLVHYTGDAACSNDCLEALYWLGQVRRAQDRHQPEVALLLVTTEPLGDSARERISGIEAPIRTLSGADGRTFAEFLEENPETPVRYILDPRAHIILRYKADSDFNGMRRDLGRLLTWTRTE